MPPSQYPSAPSQWPTYSEAPVVPPAPQRRTSTTKAIKSALKKSRGVPPPGFVPTPSPQPPGADIIDVLPPNFVPDGMPGGMNPTVYPTVVPPPGSAVIPPRPPPVFTPGGPQIHGFTSSSTSPEPDHPMPARRTQTPFPRDRPLTDSSGSESQSSSEGTRTPDYRMPPSRGAGVYPPPPPPQMFGTPAPPVIPQGMQMPVPQPTPAPPASTYAQPMPSYTPAPQPPPPEPTQPRHHSRRSRHRSDQPDARDLLRHPYSPQPEGAPAFGPGITVEARPENPLPPPPRDLYEFSPWKRLVGLPTTDFLMREGWQRPDVDAQLPPDPDSKRGGFLRAFGRKDKRAKQPGGVRYVPVFPDRIGEDAGALGAGGGGSTSGHGHTRSRSEPVELEDLTRGWQHNFVQPQPGAAAQPAPGRAVIYFTHETPYPGWMQHSAHRVIYNGCEYPSAHHLYEALRFEGREDIQRMIRAVPAHATNDVVMRHQAAANPIFDETYMQRLGEVLYLKFTQHPDLALQLLSTRGTELVYNDFNDSHWGIGPDGSGRNEFGKALMQLRDILASRESGRAAG
ncbi:hypothetical protein HDZ31DRAFT_42386 [Schizophyllum fasciatum]